MSPSTSTSIAICRERAGDFGLVLRGGFDPVESDRVPGFQDQQAASLLLFGNAGSSIWEDFSASAEYADGEPDPLNRWSERVGNLLAAEWGGMALFPFGGPPYQPFLDWAKKSESLRSSALGLLLHPEFGLWHAYRFAIALPYRPAGSHRTANGDHACDSCVAKPCLGSCPVGAFSADGYDVKSCFEYLDQNPDAACHRTGCQARVACPEGSEYLYQPAQAAFHMRQFVSSLGTKFDSDK